MATKQPKWEHGLSELTRDGAEIPDPRPVEIPIGFERPESIHETIRRLVTDPQIRADLEAAGPESFDDADDFDIPEDDFPQSPHEDVFDPHHLLAREQEINSGAVRPRTPEEIAAARKILADHNAAVKAAKAAKLKAEAEIPPEAKSA